MKEFKKILFPLDLSESSPKIAPVVAGVATKFGARIHLLFVARIFEYFSTIYVPPNSINQLEKNITEGAKKKLYEFADEYFRDFPGTQTAVVSGDPAEEIIGFVQSQGIDLVIMGTHGRKGLDKVMFGSVAERVIKSSPVPVLVVNPHKIE